MDRRVRKDSGSKPCGRRLHSDMLNAGPVSAFWDRLRHDNLKGLGKQEVERATDRRFIPFNPWTDTVLVSQTFLLLDLQYFNEQNLMYGSGSLV